MRHRRIVRDCVNLEWIFRAIDRANQALRVRVSQEVVHFELVTELLAFLLQCLLVGEELLAAF